MGVNTNKQRTVLQTDAVLGNEPSRLLVAAMTDEARRRLLELQRLLLTRMLYRLTHSHIPGIDTMSDEEIDRNIYLETKPVALFRQDHKTTTLRRAGEEAFKRLEAEEKAKKTNQDVLDRGDAIMSVSTDYVPLLGSVLRAGLYNFARLNLGYDYASNRYGYTPLISSTIDVATIPLGVGTKQLAASYAGGIGGRYVGDTYFDSPYAGLFIGTLLGGPVYNTATNVASNVNSAYKGFRLGREFNKGINSALFFNTPVEHVSNNGVTIGSALDVGNEGIHLSPVGSSTTPRVELFLLNLGQFPYVRRGIWTFTNNTAPVEVKDLGYFGKGFNKDFDTKVNEGFKNFVYSNNYEGNFGNRLNTSFLTMLPSFGLLLSKNAENKKINWFEPGVRTPVGIKLADGTITGYRDVPIDKYSLLGELVDYLGDPFYIDDGGLIFAHPEWGSNFKMVYFKLNGRTYSIGYDNTTGNVIYSTPETGGIDKLIKSGEGLTSSLAIELAKKKILDSRYNFIESLPDNEIKEIVRSQGINSKRDVFGDYIIYNKRNRKLTDILRSKVQNDIEDVYLSNEYITRYMESLGINPNNKEFRELLRTRISEDLEYIQDRSVPIVYKTEEPSLAFEGGLSNQSITNTGVPTQYRYGINSSTVQEMLLNDWTSIITHEFGHNLWASNTKLGEYIRNYDTELLKKNPLQYLNPKYAEEAKIPGSFANYVSNPNEFRLRMIEGVRYGIKEGLSPAEIYNECNTEGFRVLKEFFTKEYLIKMLSKILGIAALLGVSTNND